MPCIDQPGLWKDHSGRYGEPFMMEKKWVTARMQIQMHKVIWDPQARGVSKKEQKTE